MAGDWIKIDHEIHEKPEVLMIAQETGMDVYGVVGRLVRVWTWFDTHTHNGCANVALDAQLDAWTLCDGFAKAMRKAGWLTELGTLPNFDRHNGKTAKRRVIAAETMRRSRCANVALTAQPEKRREEKRRIQNPPTPQRGDSAPEKRKPKTPFDPLSALSGIQGSPLDSPAFRAAWAEWATHRREVHKPLTPTAVKRQLADLTAWGHDAAVASIQTSIAAGWQGLFPPKPSKQSEGDAAFDKAWRDAV